MKTVPCRHAVRPCHGRTSGLVWLLSLAACVLLMSLVLIPSGAFADEGDREVVRVGYYENEVFQEGASDGMVKTGYAYEYYRKISEYTGWRYEYVYGSYGELYQMLLDGKIDLLAGLAFTEERMPIIGYPSLPMGNESYSLVRHDVDHDITIDPKTLEGKRIGVLQGVMVGKLEEFLSQHDTQADVVVFDDYEELFAAFSSHDLDVFVAEGDGAYGRSHAVVLYSIGSSDYYLCVTKGRQDLLAALNNAQEQLSIEEPNYLHSLQMKYYPSSISSRAFSEAERLWLDEHDSLRVGYLNNYLPYSDTDEEGHVTGIVADIVPKMLSELGIEGIEITYQGYDSYDAMIEDMASGVIDLAFPVGGGLYYSEENGIYQSGSVSSNATNLVFLGDYDESTTERIAVNENNRMQYYFIKTNYPDSEILLCSSIDDCLKAVLTGKASCTTLNGLRASYILKNREYQDLSMMQLSIVDDRCFGIEIGNEGLLKLVNRGLSVIGEDYAQSLAHHYNDGLYSYSVSDFLLDHMGLFGTGVLSLAGLIIFLLVRDVRRSREQIEEKERAQRELESKNEELEASRRDLEEANGIVADAGYGIWHIELEDGKAPRLRANDKMRELLGVSDQAMGEEELYEWWHGRIVEEDLPSVQHNVEQMLKGLLSESTYRWRNPSKGVTYVRSGGFGSILEEQHQVLRGYHSDVTDIVREDQEQKEALSQALVAAERANRAKTAFLNNMSHDIRTPMNAIVGFTSLASTHIEDTDLVRDYLSKISVSSQHLLSLINDVLDMSRIESGKVTLSESEVSLSDLVGELQTIVQADAEKKELDFRVSMEGTERTEVIVDKLRLSQVLLNILSNAVKFTPEKGSINLTVKEIPLDEQDMTLLEFRIADTGIGMSEEFRKHIFEAFTRERTSTVSGIQGTGLGMAITKSVVEMMGGTISVFSREGEGSEFIIKIPCKTTSEAASASHEQSGDDASEAQVTDLTGKRVLLAEDIEMNRLIATTILKESGLQVDVACDGLEAVQMVSEAPAGTYDIVLMDIQMPNMNGYEASRKIRELDDPGKSGIPIIAVTANAYEEDRLLALDAGMDGHLAKPYDIGKMLETIRVAVS